MRFSLLVGAFAFVLLSSGPVSAQEVVAETDCWQTDPGTMAALPLLPAGFFGLGSQQVPEQLIDVIGVPLGGAELANCVCPNPPSTDVVWLDVHGDPVPMGSIHAVSPGPPDSCVRRLTDATFPGGLGVPDPVDIELVELSLRSVAPIMVVGSPIAPLWDVFITEDGAQATGSMEFTATGLGPLQGTVTVPNLPVDFQFEFVPVGGGVPILLNGNVNMQNPNPNAPGAPGNFVSFAPVSVFPGTALLLLGAGLIGVLWLRREQLFALASRRPR